MADEEAGKQQANGSGTTATEPAPGAPTAVPTAWPAADERGLVVLAGVHFDRSAVQLLRSEYTPDEIIAGLAGSNPRTWVRVINREHLERRGIGRLVVAGSPAHPVISGHRFTDWERRGRGTR